MLHTALLFTLAAAQADEVEAPVSDAPVAQETAQTAPEAPTYKLTLPANQYLTGVEIAAGGWTLGSVALFAYSSYKFLDAFRNQDDWAAVGSVLGLMVSTGSYFASTWFWVWKAGKHARRLREDGIMVTRWPVFAMMGAGAAGLALWYAQGVPKSAQGETRMVGASVGAFATIPLFGAAQFFYNWRGSQVVKDRELALVPVLAPDHKGLALALTF